VGYPTKRPHIPLRFGCVTTHLNLVNDLVHWKDPIRTLLLFVMGNLFFFLITFGEYSLLTLVSSVFLVMTAGSFINVQFFRLRGLPNPLDDTFKNVEFLISKEQLQLHVETLFKLFEIWRLLLREILYSQDLKLTLQAIGFSIAIRFVGNIFSDVLLLYLVFIFAFLWPRVYMEKQAQIDDFIKASRSRVNEKIKPHLEKIKPHLDKIKWKTD